MERPHEADLARSASSGVSAESIEAALRRFKMLVTSTTETTAGLRAPLSVGNVPFTHPQPLPRKYGPTASPDVDHHLAQHMQRLTEVDHAYPVHWRQTGDPPPEVELPLGMIEGYRRKFTAETVPARLQRTCMQCWTGQGTLYCADCTAYLCAPCCAVTHGTGPAIRHQVVSVPFNTHVDQHKRTTQSDLRAFMSQVQPLSRRQSAQGRHRKPENLKRRQVTLDAFQDQPAALLNFRPLPDPDHALPPVSKAVIQKLQREEVMCTAHPDEFSTACCLTCTYLPICQRCQEPLPSNGGHVTHHVLTLKEGADRALNMSQNGRQELQNQLEKLRHIQRNLRIIKVGAPTMIRSLKSRIRQSYQLFFRALSEKYAELHSQLAQLQEDMARSAKQLCDDNVAFRQYLSDVKLRQLSRLVALGDRHHAAGLNAYVLLKHSFAPLLEGKRFLVDMDVPLQHPWWTLNTSDGHKALGATQDSVKEGTRAVLNVIAATALHVQRYLLPSESQKVHPIEHDSFVEQKRAVYRMAGVLEDISPPFLRYAGPMPHTPEFDKLLPTLEGLMYRKDAFHAWDVVQLSLVEGFLIIAEPPEETASPREPYLCAETVIPLLEPNLQISLFSSNKISDLARRSIAEASKDLTIVNGLEIIRRRADASSEQNSQEQILSVAGYWLLGSDTEGAAEMWFDALRSAQRVGHTPGDLRFPIQFPGILPPQARVRHPPLADSHKLAAIQGLGFPRVTPPATESAHIMPISPAPTRSSADPLAVAEALPQDIWLGQSPAKSLRDDQFRHQSGVLSVSKTLDNTQQLQRRDTAIDTSSGSQDANQLQRLSEASEVSRASSNNDQVLHQSEHSTTSKVPQNNHQLRRDSEATDTDNSSQIAKQLRRQSEPSHSRNPARDDQSRRQSAPSGNSKLSQGRSHDSDTVRVTATEDLATSLNDETEDVSVMSGEGQHNNQHQLNVANDDGSQHSAEPLNITSTEFISAIATLPRANTVSSSQLGSLPTPRELTKDSEVRFEDRPYHLAECPVEDTGLPSFPWVLKPTLDIYEFSPSILNDSLTDFMVPLTKISFDENVRQHSNSELDSVPSNQVQLSSSNNENAAPIVSRPSHPYVAAFQSIKDAPVSDELTPSMSSKKSPATYFQSAPTVGLAACSSNPLFHTMPQTPSVISEDKDPEIERLLFHWSLDSKVRALLKRCTKS